MILTVFIVFFVIIFLLVCHELGHFLLAKKFGVEVEEFGVGYPPRIFGKKIGETVYSLNLLPFGAFVKIKGEEGKASVEDSRSFAQKSFWQKIAIIGGGVISFWIIAFLILTFVAFAFGLPTAVSDEAKVKGAVVEIVQVAKNSPAYESGVKIGDKIVGMKSKNEKIGKIDKVKLVQQFVKNHKGEEIILILERNKKIREVSLVPRVSPPKGEGPMGVALARVVFQKYSWWQAPWKGLTITVNQTIQIPLILGRVLKKKILGEKVEGLQVVGPIGIGQMMTQALEIGLANFLVMVGMIAIWLALFNILPIPALDGGKILFLVIGKIRKKPISYVVEQKITTFFFALLVILMIFVTFRDLSRIF